MFESASRSRPQGAAISAYRDGLLRDAPADELARLAGPLDPEDVAWLHLFRASQQEAIRPDASFVKRLDQVIATAPAPNTDQPDLAELRRLRLARSHATSGRVPKAAAGAPRQTIERPRSHAAWPQSLVRGATVVLLLVLIASSAFVALYPLGLLDRNRLSIVAPADTPLKESADQVGEALLSLTLADLPPMRTFGGLTVTDYPVGSSSQERTRKGPQVLYVVIGPLAMTVSEASVPVRVIPSNREEPSDADAQLGSGDETVLATGTTVVATGGSVIELLNTGPEPARMLVVIAADASDSDGTLRDGATWRWGSVGMPQDLTPPVSIDLRQVTINPSAALPIPPTEMGAYSAAVLDGQRVRDLSFVADLGWRNTSFAPLQAYLLKITSAPPPS